jgi:pimeloyl-ACP methyl ester carboxylesterase
MTSYGFTGAAGKLASSPVEAKLGVLIIHGVGSQEGDFANPMIEELKGRISDQAKISWQTVYWDPILSREEDGLLRELFPEGKRPDWFKLRKLVMNYIGDVTAYRYIPMSSSQTRKTNKYDDIHREVHKSIVELRKSLGNEDKPVIVIAHSLGSVIMFDYIRDRQNNKNATGYGATPFERMETLAGFITFGSPIPLFTLAYDTVPCINFPPDNLQKDLKDKAKWLNFYDHDDVFGWPLKYLSKRCEACIIEDKPVNVGDIFTFWDPLCHSKYWTDNDCTKPVAKYISEILKVCP